ncbi:type II toxin-antitoxin system RelE/ParE family toxin [Parafilimonas sp.]|uniref:type II toxin-antitoxin system RelE/ParE family toxin n=1 Tax=Parafilimonas sp. TaxID=1969739 RepID=UPI0039E635F0
MAEEIVQHVVWTAIAKKSFDKIVNYLQVYWSEKEAAQFVTRTSKMIATLKRYPEMCRPSIKRKNVRIGI